MPSTRTPTSIQIGPGQLSDNVGSASSLVASVLTTTGAPLGVDSEATILMASSNENLILTRDSSRTIVVVENLTGPVSVVLPNGAEPGDTVTVLVSTGGTNAVSVAAVNGNMLGGVINNVEILGGIYDARTYVNAATGATRSWVRTADKSVVHIDNATSTSIPEQFVLVDPSGAPKTVQLPQTPQVGDRVTVINATASKVNAITIDRGSVSNTVDGLASIAFSQPFASITVVAISATAWVSLTRSGPHVIEHSAATLGLTAQRETYVLANTTSNTIEITLPEAGLVGDSVTVVDALGTASTNRISVRATGFATIMGFEHSQYIDDQFGSISLIYASPLVWTLWKRSSPHVAFASTSIPAVYRRGPEMRMFVDTSAPTWTGTGPQDTIKTPILPSTGDRFTVCDVGGEADVKHITIVGDGTRVIGETPTSGASQTRIAKRFGTMTLLFTGTRWIEESTSNINPFVLISDTAVLERYGRDFTVQVKTDAGTWTSAATIRLPSTATQAMIGDTVTVIDTGGSAGNTGYSITVLPTVGGLINGLASFLLATNFGSTTFCYIGGNNWVTGNTGASTFPIIVPIADTHAMAARLGPIVIIEVDTANGSWNDTKTLTLNSVALPGDIIRVVDAGGSTSTNKEIKILPGGSATFDGFSNYTLNSIFSMVSFYRTTGGRWSVLAEGQNSRVLRTYSAAPVFLDSASVLNMNHTVLISTSGAWPSTGGTITLPTTNRRGQRVTIVEFSGNTTGKEIKVLSTGTINGSAAAIMFKNPYGAVTLENIGVNTWIVVSSMSEADRAIEAVTIRQFLFAWGSVAFATPPPSASGLAVVYDPVLSRTLIMKGTLNGSLRVGDDMWGVAIGTVAELAFVMGAAYDPVSGTVVAVNEFPSSYDCAYSSDFGVTFTAATSVERNAVVWDAANGLFLATLSATATVYTSPTGAVWTSRALTAANSFGIAVLPSGRGCTSIGSAATLAFNTSTNGITWTASGGTLPDVANATTTRANVVSLGTKFYVAAMFTGGQLKVHSSDDASTWILVFTVTPIAPTGNPYLLADSYSGALYLVSPFSDGRYIYASLDQGVTWFGPSRHEGASKFEAAGGRLWASEGASIRCTVNRLPAA